MSISYNLLFRTTLSHEFEGPDAKVPLALVPTDQTTRIMQQLDLREKPGVNGLEIHYGIRDDRAPALFGPDDPIRLIFRMVPQDPYFYNYTDLEATITSDSPLLLTNLNGDGNLVPKEEKSTEEEEETTAAEEEEEEEEEEETFLTDLQPGDIGLLILYLGNVENGGTYILENETVTPAEYALKFSARATAWRYLVVTRGQLENPQITDMATTETISGSSSTTTLPNGQEATAVPLIAPRILQRNPKDNLQLSCQVDGQDITLRLPTPDPKQLLAPELAESSVLRSDVYIYL